MKKTSVLVVDDNVALATSISRYLANRSCETRVAETVEGAKRSLEERACEILFVDYRLPDGTGAELVEWAKARRRAQIAYCITGTAITENVVAAMRAGCRDILEKPFTLQRLDPLVQALAEPAETVDSWRRHFAPQIVGHDPDLLRALTIARDVARSPSTVYITGESGTGKELVAMAIHTASGRDGRFVAVNCAALPENLVEAELFGHTKGAFTGAVAQRAGLILAADGGTLFLDEIGEMPLAVQARLLRVLQEHRVTPVGSDETVAVDVRVVAATHKDLDELCEAGKFREDLYHRLHVIPVHLPALRERPADIMPLARHFLEQRNALRHLPLVLDESEVEPLLTAHRWPGNVRELAHTIERATLLAKHGRITADDLAAIGPRRARPATAGALAVGMDDLNLRAALDTVERSFIRRALERTGGNRTEAAALLGLNRTTLIEKLRKLEQT